MSFAWLSQLLESFSGLLPRPVLITSNNWGVYYRLGQPPVPIGPRPAAYLPLIEEIVVMPKYQLTLELGEQTLTTADSHQITICGSLLFRIIDPVLCSVECGNHYELVAAYHARAVYQTAITACEVIDLQEMDEDSIFAQIAERLEGIGIELIEAKLIEASTSRTLKHYGIQG